LPPVHRHIEDAQAPAALRIPPIGSSQGAFIVGAREVYVASDHVDVVLIRHTDGHGGARVWAATSRAHKDTPTRYKDIAFFLYDKETPESADNIP
jgi:hypothetical protein